MTNNRSLVGDEFFIMTVILNSQQNSHEKKETVKVQAHCMNLLDIWFHFFIRLYYFSIFGVTGFEPLSCNNSTTAHQGTSKAKLCFTWKGLHSYFPEDLLTQVPVLTQMTKQTGQEQKLREIQMDKKYKQAKWMEDDSSKDAENISFSHPVLITMWEWLTKTVTNKDLSSCFDFIFRSAFSSVFGFNTMETDADFMVLLHWCDYV